MLLDLRPITVTRDATCASSVAIVVPILNEHDNIEPLVDALDRVLIGFDAEILFVDDWSRDGSADVVTRLARTRPDIRLIRRFGRHGLASAVIEGMLATTADIVLVIDGDRQHDEAIVPDMIRAVACGDAEVAIASRYRAGGSCGEWASDRALLSRIATRLAHAVIGRGVSDPLSGFFAVRTRKR
jgi:dolichol-phosphate mannosyltransferase